MTETGGAGLHADVVDRIGALVASGEFAPGTVLRADELVDRFGVSRTVVRRPCGCSSRWGWCRAAAGSGTTVAPLERWNVHDPRVIRWRLDEAGPRRPAAVSVRAAPGSSRWPRCWPRPGRRRSSAGARRRGDGHGGAAGPATWRPTWRPTCGSTGRCSPRPERDDRGARRRRRRVLAGRTRHHLMPARPSRGDPAAR
ncbi:FadR family transcriptional regulator [Pseudonocardia sp. MCCB 268]|nr:FadR family transcriptional regulator [Pseudonocardia cytotoxica]